MLPLDMPVPSVGGDNLGMPLPQSRRVQQTSPSTSQEKPWPSEKEQTDVVELRADLVTATVTVASPKGTLAKDLKAEDFEILENGIPQRISTFSRHAEMPLTLVMVFDTSGSIKSRLNFEKDTVARFLRTIMRPIDKVAIISVNTDVILQQYFTSSVNQLLAAIDRLSAEGATALYDAIEAAATALRARQGRRVIVILSDGRDTISQTTLNVALRRAQQADVVIYAINTSGQPASANTRDLAGERALETFCNQTGGEVFFPNRLEELDPAFSRLADQLRTQYVLGFYSTNEARDGSYRRLAVRVKRPNLFARAREGYYALKQ
jgi:Ca-activated chloride channel family protein